MQSAPTTLPEEPPNQLREHLKRAFPGAVGLFADIDSPISLRFLSRFDRQDRADWLPPPSAHQLAVERVLSSSGRLAGQ